jgi:hypothetical protein
MKLLRSGKFKGLTPQGKRLVEYLMLNSEERVLDRQFQLFLFDTQDNYPKKTLKSRFGYPSDLPDLTKLKPPKGNTRPKGLDTSYYSRRAQGKLPDYY